jgi:hypothetical protein
LAVVVDGCVGPELVVVNRTVLGLRGAKREAGEASVDAGAAPATVSGELKVHFVSLGVRLREGRTGGDDP